MIRRQVVMPVSPERLWDALTDPDEIAGWMGGRVDWDLEEGGLLHFHGDDGSERDGRIEAVRPGRHLRFRWIPVDPNGPDEDGESEVTYLLEPAEDGTRLTVQERRVDEMTGPQASARSTWSDWDGRLVGVWASAPVGALRA